MRMLATAGGGSRIGGVYVLKKGKEIRGIVVVDQDAITLEDRQALEELGYFVLRKIPHREVKFLPFTKSGAIAKRGVGD